MFNSKANDPQKKITIQEKNCKENGRPLDKALWQIVATGKSKDRSPKNR